MIVMSVDGHAVVTHADPLIEISAELVREANLAHSFESFGTEGEGLGVVRYHREQVLADGNVIMRRVYGS